MPAEPARSIHATAVVIGDRALVICGPSRAGKSRLALALIARATRTLPIVLIGDDRVVLHRDLSGDLVVRPHPRIVGFVERRGLGIVAMPWIARATVGGIVDLDPPAVTAGISPAAPAQRSAASFPDVPRLHPAAPEDRARAIAVLGWWQRDVRQRGSGTTPDEKADHPFRPRAKD